MVLSPVDGPQDILTQLAQKKVGLPVGLAHSNSVTYGVRRMDTVKLRFVQKQSSHKKGGPSRGFHGRRRLRGDAIEPKAGGYFGAWILARSSRCGYK